MDIGLFEIMLITSTLLEFNPLLQTIKIVRLKKSQEVSVVTFIMILIIGVMWLVYGIKINSLPLIIGNAIKLITSCTVILVYLIYKNKQLYATKPRTTNRKNSRRN